MTLLWKVKLCFDTFITVSDLINLFRNPLMQPVIYFYIQNSIYCCSRKNYLIRLGLCEMKIYPKLKVGRPNDKKSLRTTVQS